MGKEVEAERSASPLTISIELTRITLSLKVHTSTTFVWTELKEETRKSSRERLDLEEGRIDCL